VPDWLIWVIIAAALAGAETLSLDFILIMLAGGAGAGAAVAALGAPPTVQVIAAIIVAIGLLAGVRPVAQRHLNSGSVEPMHTDALIGREAVVLEQVDSDHGLVRLNGQDWTARVIDHAMKIPVGSRVVVMRIQGATAIVVPETEPRGV